MKWSKKWAPLMKAIMRFRAGMAGEQVTCASNESYFVADVAILGGVRLGDAIELIIQVPPLIQGKMCARNPL
jgi:hypothetical protein